MGGIVLDIYLGKVKFFGSFGSQKGAKNAIFVHVRVNEIEHKIYRELNHKLANCRAMFILMYTQFIKNSQNALKVFFIVLHIFALHLVYRC